MVVVLHLIALAMVAAGAAAISYGSGIIAFERGWTMVISGTVIAAGGCVTLAVATLAVRAGAILAEARRIADVLPTLRPEPVAAAPSAAVAMDQGVAPLSDEKFAPAAETPAAGSAAASPASPTGGVPAFTPLGRPRRDAPRVPPPAPPPELSAVPTMAPPLKATLNDVGTESPGSRPRPPAWLERARPPVLSSAPLAPPDTPIAEASLTGSSDQSSVGEVAEGPSSEEPTASFPEAEVPQTPMEAKDLDDGEAEPAKEALAAGEPVRTVVGSYSSGDNSYVMYSDGSIHASTPTGQYQFDSLDDLKTFLASEPETATPAT